MGEWGYGSLLDIDARCTKISRSQNSEIGKLGYTHVNEAQWGERSTSAHPRSDKCGSKNQAGQ